MKFLVSILVLLMSTCFVLSLPVQSNELKANSFDVFSLLGHLTNGTSISQVMTVLSLLNNVHHIQGDIQALPNDVVNAINQLSGLIGVTASNLTAILTGAGAKPRGLDVFSILGHLTNGTSISQVMTLLSLLNNVHHIQGDIQALPNDVVNAINQLSGLIGVTASNLTAILTNVNKPTKSNNFDVFSLLGHLTNGTSISQVMTLLSLLNNVHHIQGDIQALPNDVVNAINQLSGLIGVTASNLTAILTNVNKPTKSNNFDVFSLLGHLTNGTSISQVMTLLSLLNNVHHIQGDIQALPNDVVNAINQLSNLVGITASNLTAIITGTEIKPTKF